LPLFDRERVRYGQPKTDLLINAGATIKFQGGILPDRALGRRTQFEIASCDPGAVKYFTESL
jgi:hypothetical protein